jgi:hypothetical protein
VEDVYALSEFEFYKPPTRRPLGAAVCSASLTQQCAGQLAIPIPPGNKANSRVELW